MVFKDFEGALTSMSQNEKVNEVFVIGGSSIYEQALGQFKDNCKMVIATRINKKYECDTLL